MWKHWQHVPLGKLQKKFEKKVKTDLTLPKFLQEEIGNAHIFFGLTTIIHK
jgi:hypothetical protein